MAKEIEPAPQGAEPFADVSPVDPGKVQSEPGQDAAPAKGNTTAPQAPQNYFNVGAPVIEEKPVEAKAEGTEPASSEDDGGNQSPPAAEPPVEETQPETKEEPKPAEAPEGTTEAVDWEQNYKELRSKFNERDTEIKGLRDKVEEAEKNPDQSEEFKTQLDEAKGTLKEYERWYNENYPVFKKAVEDPQFAAKLKEIQRDVAQPLTSDQVRQIAREAQEDVIKQSNQEQLIDKFADSNKKAFNDPLVQSRFKAQIEHYPDGYTFNDDTLGIMLENAKTSVGYKEGTTVPVKTKEDRQKAVADTQVGQGTSTPPATPAPNEQKRSLFEAPPGRVSSGGMFG